MEQLITFGNHVFCLAFKPVFKKRRDYRYFLGCRIYRRRLDEFFYHRRLCRTKVAGYGSRYGMGAEIVHTPFPAQFWHTRRPSICGYPKEKRETFLVEKPF